MSNNVDLLKPVEDATGKLLKQLVMNYLVKEIPSIGLPILNPIMGFLTGIVINALMKQMDNGVYHAIIVHRIDSEIEKFKHDQDALNNAPSKPNEGLTKEEQDLMDSGSDLINFGRGR